MGKRKETKAAKVSISMDADLFQEALGRARELGMASFSKYVAHTLREDVVRRGNFIITQRQPPPPPAPAPGKPKKGAAK